MMKIHKQIIQICPVVFEISKVNTVAMATVIGIGQIAYFVWFSTKNHDLLFDNALIL